MSRSLNALAPYYGCKRQLSKRVIDLAGKHSAWWNIMCGSCSEELEKPESRMTVVNDLNGGIVNLARVIASEQHSVGLFERLYRTTFCEQLFKDSVGWLTLHNINGDFSFSETWAYHYFVMSWQGRNGFVGTVKELDVGFAKRYDSGGGDGATRFKNAVENIPSFFHKMRRWTILTEDALVLVDKIEDKEGTIVRADPPYLVKDLQYIHDFNLDKKSTNFSKHDELAVKLSRFEKTRVIVSYYEHPHLDTIYLPAKWHKTYLDVNKNLSGKAEKAPEILLTNWNPLC